MSEAGVFSVLDDAEADARGGGQDLAHDVVLEDGKSVVCDGHDAGGLEGRIVVDGVALRSAGGGGDGEDADDGAALRGLHPAGGFGRVVDRERVGHGGHGGKAARRRRGRAGGDGLLVGVARLAQMDVNIDQPRRHGETGCVQNIGAVGRLQLAGRGDLGHAAVLEQDVLGEVDAGGRVDQMTSANRKRRHARPPFAVSASSARSTTAMRMATPLRTCSRITDCGPSATPAVTSRPRMMGPGCRTTASGACAASR